MSFLGFACVGALGFAADAGVLALGLKAGLSPAVARAISTPLALQLTFVLNGLAVFRTLTWRSLPRRWLAYMVANAFGAGCNYLVFVALTASRLALVSEPVPAFLLAAALAMAFNYAGARWVAFAEPARAKP